MIRLSRRDWRLGSESQLMRALALGISASLIATVTGPATGSEGAGTTVSKSVEFNRDIRPILADKCFKCHGPDARERKGKLRLDNAKERASPAASGSVAIVPGKLDDSELYQRIIVDGPGRADAAAQERQDAFGRRDRQAQDLDRRGGRISRALGVLASSAAAASGGEKRGLVPYADRPVHSGPARSRGTQALARGRQGDADPAARPRRDRAAADDRSKSTPSRPIAARRPMTKLVERLLESPHYGERWGRIWLDAARYADSDGYEKDKSRQVYFYRDWVIGAFNRDLPYNQFIIEQIAGDQLPGATQDQIVATGFLRNSMINEEGGVDPEQFRMEAMFDRMDCIGKGILGLTIQCAQCHSHKYDPLTQEEYYGMFAFLNNADEANVAVYTPRGAVEESEDRPRDPRRRRADQAPSIPTGRRGWPRGKARSPAISPRGWSCGRRSRKNRPGGRSITRMEDGSFLVQGYAPTKHTVTMSVKTDVAPITAFRLELLTDANLPMGGPGRSIKGTGALTEFRVEAAPADGKGSSIAVKFSRATADVNPPETPLESIFDDKSGKKRVTGPIGFAIDGKNETAWGIDVGPGRRNQPRKAVFTAEKPVGFPGGTILTFHLAQNHGGWNSDDNQNNNLGRFRLSITTAPGAVGRSGSAERPGNPGDPARETDRQRRSAAVFSYWRTTVPEWNGANAWIDSLWKQHPEGATQLALSRAGRNGGRLTC